MRKVRQTNRPELTSSCRAVLAVVTAAFILGGCYESTDARFYEPHVYKGKQDSKRIMKSPPELEKALSNRLQRGQTDR